MTHWIADSLTLWKSPLTDAHLYTAAAYYSLLAKMNSSMAASAVAVVTLGFMALLLSVQDGEAGNLMFDGASICMSVQYFLLLSNVSSLPVLYGSAAAVYVYSALPNLSGFQNLTPFAANLPSFPSHLRQPTIELASSHLICAVCLTGVLILQTARYWAEGEEDGEEIALTGMGAGDAAGGGEVVDASGGNWKRARRASATEPVETTGSIGRSTRRSTHSPSVRRRSPVKRRTTNSALAQ